MKLRYLATGRIHSIQPDHLVGRNPACDLQLDNPRVSGRHAEFRFAEGIWLVRDLGSSNGCFADDQEISGQRALEVGMRLAFGDPDDCFEVLDVLPPLPHARWDDGQEIQPSGRFLAIPDADDWQFMIVDDGAGNWSAETRDGDRRPVADGQVLAVADRHYTLHIPFVAESTWQADRPRFSRSHAHLTFRISRDQETIDLVLEQAGERHEWRSRVHHELLLRLAEERIRDQQAGTMPETEHGWLPAEFAQTRLHRKLRANTLYQYIHRAREQFAAAGVMGAADVIERRHGAGTMRLGFAHLAIVPS